MRRTINIKRVIAIILLCFSVTRIVALATSNNDWTEAKYTTTATKKSWDAWCKQWDKIKSKPTQMVLTPGKDATQMNFSWYSYLYDIKSSFRYSTNKNMYKPVNLQVRASKATKGFVSNKAVATHLKMNKTYYYQYTVYGKWSEVYSFTIRNPKEYQFIFVGDPQIGSSSDNIPAGETKNQGQSRGVCNDSYNWNATLEAAYKRVTKASFIVSAGDQIQSRNLKNSKKNYKTFCQNEMEYAGFLMPKLLRSIPVATSIGNHDYLSANYTYHFNNPNSNTGLGKTYAGQDYYFNYGDTIFIMLNTNNPTIKEHEAFIKKALKSNKTAKWRIITMHQDIFGSGKHSNEEDVIALRKELLPVLRKYKINLVLTGHDHTYARAFIENSDTRYEDKASEPLSRAIKEDRLTNQKTYGSTLIEKNIKKNKEEYEKITANIVKYKSEDGILFITANSSSGSKYYEMVTIPQDYIEARSQQYRFAYTTVKVKNASIQLDTYDTQSGTKIDKTIIITR